MFYFKNICINSFRGIRDLEMKNLGKVNLIVGDNNCGKTSILEAIQFLRSPDSLNNALRIARIRDAIPSVFRSNIFSNFINMFPSYGNKAICISSNYESPQHLLGDRSLELEINGESKKVMFDRKEYFKSNESFSVRYPITMLDDGEIDVFEGKILVNNDGLVTEKTFQIDSIMSVTGRRIREDEFIRIRYLSPIDHMVKNVFDSIIKNATYKKICIKALQLFDDDITDLQLQRDNYRNILEFIEHRKSGLMPITTYGDGIKKVLAIANMIAQSSDGILLIDEIDTAIHARYYDDIFKFIIKASEKYNVQLFITTHSIEAVDGLLKTRVIDEIYDDKDDPIRVITLRKDKDLHKTLSRTMTGGEVHANREKFNFEVRI